MHKIRFRFLFFILAIAGVACFLGSCTTTRELVYMQGKFDTAALRSIPQLEPIIRKNDLLSITVYSDNPDATKIYNQQQGTSGVPTVGSVTATPTTGYQVDPNGNIFFQGLGLLHVEGLTKAQLKDTLDIRLKPFLTNPYYNIRFLNYRFTILGEVARPNVYTIPGERISLLEALGLAGDLTFFGRRDNVLIIRENDSARQWGRLDLTKPDIISSPFFYIQQNDVVIVEPTNKKISATDQTLIRNLSITTSIVSLLILLYSVFK